MSESDLQHDVIIIHGTTGNSKVFRPSDWAERLCGILSSFTKDNRLSYSEWVSPVLIDKIRCVSVDVKLQDINPGMFRFLTDFAADNDLRVFKGTAGASGVRIADSEGAAAPSATPAAAPAPQPAPPAPEPAQAPRQSHILREIPPAQTASAFAALSVLRPLLTDINSFVDQINRIQRPQGYRLLGVFEEGKANAVAVCGFREETNLASGRHLHIDDLVTVPQSRGRGYASQLLAEVEKTARASGIGQLHIDSSVGSNRTTAHRVYFQHGFDIAAYHFVCGLDREYSKPE